MAIPGGTWEFPLENGIVVVRPDLPLLFWLNPTAGLIWRNYRETLSAKAAADLLVEVFGISRELAAQDVTAILNSWSRTGLLGPTQTPATPRWDGHHGESMAVGYCGIEGTTFLLETDSPEVIAEVGPRLEGLRVGACQPDVTISIWSGADDTFAIVVGAECVAVEQGVRAARTVLFQEIVRLARSGREWLALLHAGACGIDGRVVLFPAASYSGKSTLAATLRANGFALYSDDFVGIETDGLGVPAMPFAIAVRRGSWNVLRDWIPELERCDAVERFGEQVKFLPIQQTGGLTPGTAVAIVFSEWVAGAEISVRSLSTAEVIERLNESGFWVAHDEASIGTFLGWLERMPKYAIQYGELTDAVAQVRAIALPIEPESK